MPVALLATLRDALPTTTTTTTRSSTIAKQKRLDLQRVAWEFFCKACANEFEADWAPEQDVVCTRCGTSFETAYQLTARDELVGPWLTRRAAGQDAPG